MRKRIIRISLALFAILCLGLGGTVYYIDQIGKWAVERGATYALGVPTHLGEMDIGLTGGSVELGELEVANPSGFKAKDFLSLGEGRVAVALGTLMEERVEIPELTLRNIDMSLERKEGAANYQPILDNLARLSSGEAAAADSPGEKKFVIRKVNIEDITVDVQLTSIGGSLTQVPVNIEKIELTDVGTDSDRGVLLSELTGIITKAILTAVVRKAGGVLPDAIAGELGAGLERIGKLGGATMEVVGEVTARVGGEVKKLGELGHDLAGSIGQTGEGLKDAASKTKEEAKEAGKELKEGFGKLLGKKEKKDGG